MSDMNAERNMRESARGIGFNGTVTVENTETGAHRTFRIRTQKETASFAPGSRVAQLMNGPDNERSFKSFGFVKMDGSIALWKRFRIPGSDFPGLARALTGAIRAVDAGDDTVNFGETAYKVTASKKCRVCNRKLTTPESLERGIGPECARNHGLA